MKKNETFIPVKKEKLNLEFFKANKGRKYNTKWQNFIDGLLELKQDEQISVATANKAVSNSLKAMVKTQLKDKIKDYDFIFYNGKTYARLNPYKQEKTK